jgi:hypothetical protein
MIKIPEASPATASISGLVAGVLISLIMLSHQVLGEGVLSGLIFLLLGGVSLWLFVAFVGGFGKLMKRRGWGPALQWYLQAFLFGACLLAVVIFFDTQVMPLISADLK